ncbi:oligosaccharyltransferase complex subunit gamma, partial [Lecanoromycetidae sp. Uapishka_2]
MKLIGLSALALLPFLCVAAKKSSLGTFDSYHAKSQASPPLKLDDVAYEELTATPRNHSVIVLLTALEARFGCQLCRDFQPEWDLLGKSWAKGDKNGDTRTILGTLDFVDGKGTFQKLMLQTAPIFLLFPPTTGPNAKSDGQPIRYDFTAGKVPYVAGDGKGGISYFAGGFQSQFGMETQIVAAMYGILAFATIALALKVPRMSDPKQQQFAVFVWGGVMLGMYSFLMSVFRIKNGGYPFHLPPF